MEVSFYTKSSGKSFIVDFLKKLSSDDQAAILATFDDIRGSGFSAVGCDFRQIEGKLWEVKIRLASGGYRFFYVMLNRQEMHILHAYKKQSQKAPKKELDIARKRLKEALT